MLKKRLRLEHQLDSTARFIIKYGTLIASILLFTAIVLSHASNERLYSLHVHFVEVGMFVFAEGIIVGLLFDVIRKRQQ